MDKEIEKLKKSIENIQKVLQKRGLVTEPPTENKPPLQKQSGKK